MEYKIKFRKAGEKMEEQAQQSSPNPSGGQSDAEKNKGIAIAAYFVFFVPIIAAKDSKFAMYHANQGLNLLLFWLAGWIGLTIISLLLGMTVVLALIVPLLWLIFVAGGVAFLIMGIINASKGEMKPLPLIGKINLLIK